MQSRGEAHRRTYQEMLVEVSRRVESAADASKRFLLRRQSVLRCEPEEMCLITGAPRSGTGALSHWLRDQPGTLVFSESRQLLAVHRFVQETQRFKRLRPKRDALQNQMRHVVYSTRYPHHRVWGRVWIEKEPLEPIAFPNKDYSAFLESVRRVWPELKLLFMVRDPVACIWSMVRRPWGFSVEDTEVHRFSLNEHIETWKACARLIAQHHADEHTYVCQFERLVEHPASESRRIGAFLSLAIEDPFEPRPTKTVRFSDEEKACIQDEVHQELTELSTLGLIDVDLLMP